MLRHLFIHFPLYYWSTGCLQDVKTKENFKLFALKERERGGRLQDVPNVVICPKNVWYFGKLVAEKR